MLDQMRKHSRSFIIYIFFGIIIAVFVINFGPQSQGCVAETSYAGQINGEPLSVGDVSYALSIVGFGGQGLGEEQLGRLRAFAVDRLIVRELLADRASELGLVVSEQQIRDMLLEGRYLALGMPRRLTAEDEALDYDRFSKYVRFNWRITVRKFKEQQRRELLAAQLKEMQRLASKASPEEAKQDYLHRNTIAELSYVRIDPDKLAASVAPTPEELQRFIAANAKAIETHYETNKASYTNRPEEVRLRGLAIAFDEAGGKEAALRQAASLRARLAQGAEFARLAREKSVDESKARGGDRGWVKADDAPFGEEAKVALKKLPPGEVSEPVASDERVYLFKVEDRRKGDLALDQVREEIGRELFAARRADERAKSLAEKYIAQLRAGQKAEELFAGEEQAQDEPKDGSQAPASAGDGKPSATPVAGAGPEAEKPKLQNTGPFTRSAEHLVPGIGISKELSELAFKLEAGQVVDHPIKIGDIYYVALVKERENADIEEWTKRKGELAQAFTEQRWAERERQIESELCEQAVKSKRVRIDLSTLTPREPGTEQPAGPAYVPCQTLRLF